MVINLARNKFLKDSDSGSRAGSLISMRNRRLKNRYDRLSSSSG